MNSCPRKLFGHYSETSGADCQPWCLSYCQDRDATPSVPPQVMKKWEDLYDKVMKGSDVGCQPYFAPPTALDRNEIRKRQYRQQTVYQDVVHRALERQIRPSYDVPKEEKREELQIKSNIDDCGDCSKAELELLRLTNLPPVEIAYRNFEAKKKGIEREEDADKSLPRLEPSKEKETFDMKQDIGKVLIDPDVKKREFISLAKTVTFYDAEKLKCVEELWAAVGPMLIELNDKEKRKALKRINKELYESKRIQHGERHRLLRENHAEVKSFIIASSAELEKKYNRIINQYRAALTRDYELAVECLLKSCDALNNFEIEWARPESVERFQEDIKVFTQYCNIWMRIMGDVNDKTKLNEQELITKDLRIIGDVQEKEEARILDSLTKLNKDHDMIISTLADYLYRRDQTIARLKLHTDELQKKSDIWKNLAGDLMGQFQKFVTFTLESQPFLTQYLLSMDEMYNRFLEDCLEAEREKDGKEIAKTAQERARKEFPTCGPPDRLSRETSDEIDLPVEDSSLDITETDDPGTNVLSDYYLEALKTGEFPAKPASFDELRFCREQEIEAVVQTFGYEEPTNDSWSTDEPATKTASEPGVVEVPLSPLGDCAYMEDSTKEKVDIVLNLMHSRPQLMKGFVVI